MRLFTAAGVVVSTGRDVSGSGRLVGRPPKPLDPTGSARALLGAELRRLRQQQGLVLADLRRLTGYSVQHIGAVERATSPPSEGFVVDCDRALGAGGHLTEIFGDVLREQLAERSRRRSDRRAGSQKASLEPPVRVDWDRIEWVASRRFQPTAQMVDDMAAITCQYRSAYHHLPSTALIGPATAHLETIKALLERAPSGMTERRLASLGQETAGLVAWLRHDLGDGVGAQVAYQTAEELQALSGNRVLAGYVTAFRGMARAARGDLQESRADLAVAQGQMGRGAPPMPVAWVSALRAEAAASTSNKVGALALLRRADRALERAGTDPGVEWMYVFDRGRLAAHKGVCLLALGRPREAQVSFGAALAAVPDSCVRRRADIVLRLAYARAELRDIDGAQLLAIQACEGFLTAGSTAGVGAVRRLRTRLVRQEGPGTTRILDDWVREHLEDSIRG